MTENFGVEFLVWDFVLQEGDLEVIAECLVGDILRDIDNGSDDLRLK